MIKIFLLRLLDKLMKIIIKMMRYSLLVQDHFQTEGRKANPQANIL